MLSVISIIVMGTAR